MGVCKILRAAYLQSWDINHTLKRVVDNPSRFREHVRACGGLIAGRLIYEFFARIRSPRTGITIYLQNCPNVPLTRYLVEEEGYGYCGHDPEVPPPPPGAPGPTRVDANVHITAFCRTLPPLVTIVLVICPTHPIETMLRCNYLSAAMNFLTHDKAVCLFPRLTFLDRVSMLLPRLLAQIFPLALWNDLLGYSEDYGWTDEHHMNLLFSDEKPDPTGSFNGRTIGDGYTWMLPIEPAPAFNEALLPSRSRTADHWDPPPDFDPFLNHTQANAIQTEMPGRRWSVFAFTLSLEGPDVAVGQTGLEALEFELEYLAISHWDEEDVEGVDYPLLIESLEG
ncbi:hypothetical protein BDY17DRAFT_304445 [Neohortaea acidophila]|uniref:Uncharacterized protein n=1 Tax=Neohortaea acidophila TaxID=245834 RepID=A0A6A6PI19_9PEZI|nr:uncharacterized protein BDY17DRAFT_304445 [Neohortaea acidophila]KAF2479688.1 hypothetical protein BDY17DRAFT_304445 [Neohortaea acidophila]